MEALEAEGHDIPAEPILDHEDRPASISDPRD